MVIWSDSCLSVSGKQPINLTSDPNWPSTNPFKKHNSPSSVFVTPVSPVMITSATTPFENVMVTFGNWYPFDPDISIFAWDPEIKIICYLNVLGIRFL